MKRLLCALMLLASTASADRLAIVKPYTLASYGSLTGSEYGYAERDLRAAADLLGMDYDVLPQNVLHGNTAAQGQDLDLGLGAGSIVIGGVTKNYGASVHFWWGGAFTKAWGYNPDTLTRVAAWPSKSQLFIGPPAALGSTQWSTSSTCSTGIGASSVGLPFGNGEGSDGGKSNGRASSVYLAGNQLMWKNWNCLYPLGLSTTASWPGITRGIIGIKTVLATATYNTCNACDGGTRSDPPDSVTMWYRQRTTGTGAPYGSRLIFAWPAAQGSNNMAIMQYVMALAALDSASGGRLIGQVPGWTPKKLAIYVDKYLFRSNYTATGNDDNHGLYFPDSTSYWAHTDSLDALGVPYTLAFQADRDTIARYPYDLVRLRRLVNARFTPEIHRGAYAAQGGSTRYAQRDVFGANLTRPLYNSPPPYAPANGDTSVYAGLVFARALADSLFPGRVSRAIYPPGGDWVPKQYTSRANLPDKNELAKAIWYAGFRTLLIDPDRPDLNPNMSFATATGGTFVSGATDPEGLFAAERRIKVYSDSTYTLSGGFGGASQGQQSPVGSVFFAAVRSMRAESAALNLNITHNYSEEFLWGALTGNWYRTDIAFYYHYFHTPLSVLMMSSGYMGGDGTGSNQAAGWWQIKWTVNQIKAVNKLAGRTVIRIVDAGEL